MERAALETLEVIKAANGRGETYMRICKSLTIKGKKKILVQKPLHSKESVDLSRFGIEDKMHNIASKSNSHKSLKATVGAGSVNTP